MNRHDDRTRRVRVSCTNATASDVRAKLENLVSFHHDCAWSTTLNCNDATAANGRTKLETAGSDYLP